VRTCPACGEDTKAGYSEACTRCGFSPGGPVEAPETFSVGEVATSDPSTFERPGGVEAPPQPTDSGGEQLPQPSPTEPQPQPHKRRRPGVGLMIWLVIIGASVIANTTGIFDEPTGPDPAEVEGALVLAGIERGLSITAECPADTDEAEIGAGFECVVTTASGRSGTVRVTNHEESYEYNVADLEALRGGRP
jgi:hypothetical protein